MKHIKIGIRELKKLLINLIILFVGTFKLIISGKFKTVLIFFGKLLYSFNISISHLFIQFKDTFKNDDQNEFSSFSREQLDRLQKTASGLHSQLNDGQYSYSILIPVYKPKPDFFRAAVYSATLV